MDLIAFQLPMMNEKIDLRRVIKTKLASFNTEMFKNEGIEAGKRIIAGSIWKKAQTILLFMSMSNEIDTHFLLDAALSCGKNLFVPRIDCDDMTFYQIDTLDAPWEAGVFGILEPTIDNKKQFLLAETEFPLLVIVPGMAFAPNGHRLGRGKGYYDRFLSEIRTASGNITEKVTVVGICLTEQLLDHVPAEDFDQKVDAIYTGNGYIEVI